MALVRATHHKMLSQYWAGDRMEDDKWTALGGEREGQEQAKDTQLGDEENNYLSAGKICIISPMK